MSGKSRATTRDRQEHSKENANKLIDPFHPHSRKQGSQVSLSDHFLTQEKTTTQDLGHLDNPQSPLTHPRNEPHSLTLSLKQIKARLAVTYAEWYHSFI